MLAEFGVRASLPRRLLRLVGFFCGLGLMLGLDLLHAPLCSHSHAVKGASHEHCHHHHIHADSHHSHEDQQHPPLNHSLLEMQNREAFALSLLDDSSNNAESKQRPQPLFEPSHSHHHEAEAEGHGREVAPNKKSEDSEDSDHPQTRSPAAEGRRQPALRSLASRPHP